MKKEIAKVIRESAEKLPLIFEWEAGSTTMLGHELNLTPLADKQIFEPSVEYEVMVPQLRAVVHEQQMKDAYKTKGAHGVVDYIDRVYAKAKGIQKSYE